MSILIKGMEMPTSCMACLFQTPYMGGWCSLLNDNSNAYSRRHDCPLIPVPPHGRLIDADALLRVIHDAYEVRDAEQNAIMDKVSMLVIAAPTIIPAEEGEDG